MKALLVESVWFEEIPKIHKKNLRTEAPYKILYPNPIGVYCTTPKELQWRTA
jgi:hypothetical protein